MSHVSKLSGFFVGFLKLWSFFLPHTKVSCKSPNLAAVEILLILDSLMSDKMAGVVGGLAAWLLMREMAGSNPCRVTLMA